MHPCDILSPPWWVSRRDEMSHGFEILILGYGSYVMMVNGNGKHLTQSAGLRNT